MVTDDKARMTVFIKSKETVLPLLNVLLTERLYRIFANLKLEVSASLSFLPNNLNIHFETEDRSLS